MPFGLRNAPATFQRLMDLFCRNLPVMAYLDDIIVLSPAFDQHFLDLETVFLKLKDYKLRANRSKCHFACSRVKYLGLWITSQIARPLSNLTKKKTFWTWTESEQNAFTTLKNCLVSPPILSQADFTNPSVLWTDASNYAFGAVLLQGSDMEEHPIEYASRLLTSVERNYSTTEREALAVVWALNKFRGRIEGSKITVASDHQALKWLMKLKSPSGRLARWALQLQSFDLNLEHIPGKSNVVADMLSRLDDDQEIPSCEENTVSIDFPARSPMEIREEQLKDEDLRKIIYCFENDDKDVNHASGLERGYLMNQGVLYRYSHNPESEEAQLVVPTHERDKILKEYHDSLNAAHYGSDGTFQIISKRYFWIGMRKFITNYIKNCLDCARFKTSNQKPTGLLQTLVQAQRFETIAIDLFSPLPESKDKKKCIFIVEEVATRWVELFALPNAIARECEVWIMFYGKSFHWIRVTQKSHQQQRYPTCLRCYATNVLPSENLPIIYSSIPSTNKSCGKKKP
ncbi:Transposon Tf2-6 polyprotein [Araneus ventricosus]|uniref:RNA-directed DNA polymerase n=1 Tax=Araneus ventricosus TaxID=182803 RepID=A0A4Y2FHK3_ARAVE|nr:Transposon Tf2-6 polyprotein [Araneus ventricosus]